MTAAAAAREVEADRGLGDGLCPRREVSSPELEMVLVIVGDPDKALDLEGGSEFKSGAIGRYGLLYARQ